MSGINRKTSGDLTEFAKLDRATQARLMRACVLRSVPVVPVAGAIEELMKALAKHGPKAQVRHVAGKGFWVVPAHDREAIRFRAHAGVVRSQTLGLAVDVGLLTVVNETRERTLYKQGPSLWRGGKMFVIWAPTTLSDGNNGPGTGPYLLPDEQALVRSKYSAMCQTASAAVGLAALQRTLDRLAPPSVAAPAVVDPVSEPAVEQVAPVPPMQVQESPTPMFSLSQQAWGWWSGDRFITVVVTR